MIWRTLHLENYRSFPRATHCELRPLTLFFGYNSAGKSALLRSLPLLSSSLRGGAAPIDLAHAVMRNGSFSDLLSRPPLRESNRLQVEIDLSPSITESEPVTRTKWQIFEAPELRRQVITEFTWVSTKGVHFDASVNTNDDPARFGRTHQLSLEGKPLAEQADLQFRGLLPADGFPSVTGDLATEWGEVKAALCGTATAVQWLTSVRATPPRSQVYPGAAPVMLAPDGAGAMAALAYDEPLRQEVSQWFETNLQLRLTVVPTGEQFQVVLENLRDEPLRVPIADVGEGLIQVLPVLVAAAMVRDPAANGARILAVEEPESHLHPRLHAALAARFCTLAALNKPPQIVLETHSEIFLAETQYQIAKGILDPSRVMVYWVRGLEDGSTHLEPITFDELGRPKGNNTLPRGVFAEDTVAAKKLLSEQQKRFQR